jgi:hypothetical protein
MLDVSQFVSKLFQFCFSQPTYNTITMLLLVMKK